MITPYINIDESLGKISNVEMPVQDVYRVAFGILDLNLDGPTNDEVYLIPKNYAGSVISQRALSFGTESGDLLLFESKNKKRFIIEYELAVERMKSADTWDVESIYWKLQELSTYGRKYYPQYFGAFIPPALTPCGPTTRWCQVCNGIFFVESCKKWHLAICYPIWNAELDMNIYYLGNWNDADANADINKTLGYLFFTDKACAPAIYQLMQTGKYPEFGSFIRSHELLVAAIWEYTPTFIKKQNQESKEIPQATVSAGPFLILPD